MTKKFLFWIDLALTNYCLSYGLQKKSSGDYYAIIDCPPRSKSFFQTQSFVKFTKQWFFHDEVSKINPSIDIDYLSKFETKYGINLWNLAINERIFYRFNRIYKFSDNEILSILENECKLFESILDEIQPDYFITKEPPLHHHQLFYELCKAKGVKILMFNQPNTSKCIISEKIRTIDGLDDLLDIPTQGRDFDSLLQVKDSWKYNSQVKNFVKTRGSSNRKLLRASIEYLFISKNPGLKKNFSFFGRTKKNVLFDSIKMKLLKKIRKSFIDKNLLEQADLSKKFIYFPMGVDEERNLLITAPYYTNQIELLRSIAKSLPIGFRLYVKENPTQEIRYWRSISEYKEIMSIPNVYLFHPNFSNIDLLKHCSMVITIAGSSGLEAPFYQKPSLVFADTGYSILPSVKRVPSIEKLPKSIREMLSVKVNNSDLDRYVTLLEKNSIPFNLLNFELVYQNYFFHGGHFTDVEISLQRMQRFLNKYISLLEPLIQGYIEKIKNCNINSNLEKK